ncbi:hypothetical protein H5187_18350 [Pseudoalteromonas sp. SG44-1]|uniref:hypothetical protein n=2 Tax=Bacteria TaxID=2 RepID=UPI00160180A2|nr:MULTISPECIES: hypothetical protein [unclassified Pseudoalteromonas]MBB1419215.1 hypothetical protein [Pseudoalteromonas sp. SG44-1]MBB1478040.1 hypothetical protein [Pseudoalteromonas sp. SG41-2]
MSNFSDYIDVISCNESIIRHDPIADYALLYPLWAYNITLPIVEHDTLNPLETVVYELIANKEHDVEKIAMLIGLKVELVEFIISRLQQLDFINSRLQMIEANQQKVLDKDNIKYIAATVYYDIKNKMYLPRIVKDGFPIFYAQKDKNKYKFNMGTSGELKEVEAAPVSFDKKVAPELTPTDALNIIRNYRNALKKERLTNNELNEYCNIPATSIEVDKSPQLVYLHQRVFIPDNSADVFVTNGFNGSINPEASRGFERHNNSLYKKLKEKAERKKLRANRTENFIDESSIIKLNKIYQYIINNTITSSAERKLAIDNQADFFKGIYSELENLLARSASLIPVKNVLTHIHSTNASVNGRNIANKVKKIGFNTNKLANYFFNIKKGTFSYLDYNDPNMTAMIALNAISAEQAVSHPFIELAKENPDFFERVNELKKLRDAASHGDIVSEIKDKLEIKEWYQWIESVCKVFGNDISEEFVKNGIDHRTNLELTLSREMDKHFNWHQKASLPLDVVEVIRSALKKQLENNLSDTVTDCASALQKSFYHAMKYFEPVRDISLLLAESRSDVIARKIIPTQIEHRLNSSKERLERACQGVDSTLGANAMAFIYRVHDNDLEAFPKRDNLLSVTSRLVELRGHNRRLTEADISLVDLEKLVTTVFKMINDLMERFGE